MQELDARLRIAEGSASGAAAPADSPRVSDGAQSGEDVNALTIAGSILAATGLALGISSLATGLVAHDIYGQLDCDAEGLCPVGSQPRIDEGYGLALSSTILLPIAVAAGAAGLIMLFVGLAEPTRQGPSLTSGPGDLGLALMGVW